MKKAEAYWPLLMLLALLKFVLPLLLQDPLYELQRDEYLYYQQGLHFDLGYMENPPLLSYLGMISSWLGGSVAWIKFWPSLFGAATLVVTCLIAAELGGKLFAQFLAGLCVMTGAYLRVHFLFQPNFLDIFFWTLAIYFIIRYINDKDAKFLYLFSISLALGFWGKYSVLFIIFSILLALLLSQHRKVFLEKKLYIAGLISLLIILPNVWWQYQHNWPLVHHMEELQETQLKYINPSGFLTDQLMMLIATTMIWITGLVWVLRQKQWRFLGYIYLLVILLLILGRGKSYYSLGIYPMLLAAGAVAWERWTERRYWIRYTVSIIIIGFTYMILPMLLPIWKPEKLAGFYEKIGMKHKWEDQKNHSLPQDFADMLGWKELTVKTESFFNSLPETTKRNTVIYCRHYGQAGSLKFYGKDGYFKNKVITDNGSFL
ncbi:MAG: glycosyltransferase family 39 protein, partial [Ferruginibacter sp.]|nr:glycosyltransferase family 39 protein [Chitinophagaceae bacterium]